MENSEGCSDRIIGKGFTIFAAAPSDDLAISMAKKYIKDNELTQEDVSLGRIGSCVVVVTKRPIELLL